MEENAGYAIARLDLGGSKCPAGVGSPKFSGKFKLEKDRVFNISFFLGIPGPGRNQQEIYHLVVSQCHNDASPSFTCQFLFTQLESHKTALARACCTSSFNLFTRVKPLVTFIHGEFDMSARPNWRALHGSLL